MTAQQHKNQQENKILIVLCCVMYLFLSAFYNIKGGDSYVWKILYHTIRVFLPLFLSYVIYKNTSTTIIIISLLCMNVYNILSLTYIVTREICIEFYNKYLFLLNSDYFALGLSLVSALLIYIIYTVWRKK